MDDDRGKIHFRNRVLQLRDFSGIRYNNITPTDLDFAIEYHDKKIIIGELKYDDAKLPEGQRLLLERFVNDFTMAGKSSIAFVGKHYVSDCTQDIIVAEVIVDEVYYKGEWKPNTKKCTVKRLCDWFLKGEIDNGTR